MDLGSRPRGLAVASTGVQRVDDALIIVREGGGDARGYGNPETGNSQDASRVLSLQQHVRLKAARTDPQIKWTGRLFVSSAEPACVKRWTPAAETS